MTVFRKVTIIERSGGPYDRRLGRILIRPMARMGVHPNQVTLLSFGFGVAAALLFASGDGALVHWAAAMSMLAVFTDHIDGELARMTGRTSAFGHTIDYVVGSANYTMLFIGIGWGLAGGLAEALAGGMTIGPGQHWYIALGFAAGLSNPLIVALRMTMERRFGAASVAHPAKGGFELEDFIYLIGPITWAGGLVLFFILYGLGNLGYLAWTIHRFRRNQARAKEGSGA